MTTTELATMLAYGKICNPYKQDNLDNYYSILFALNELGV